MQNIIIYGRNNEVDHAYKNAFGYQLTSSLIIIYLDEIAAVVHPITPERHVFIENIKEESPELSLPDNVVPLN